MNPSTDSVVAAVLVLLNALLCTANVQFTLTQFIKRKTVATSYFTLQPYSKFQCAEKCFYHEKKQNRCSFAQYNEATQTCLLSNDDPTDLLDTADDVVGVLVYSGMCIYEYNVEISDTV